MSKKDETINELEYALEAAEDEISLLQEETSAQKKRIWELIKENDRLTLAYEPYHPPGHENENVSYYELIEENKSLKAALTSTKPTKRHYAGCISLDFWPIREMFRLSFSKWNPGKYAQLVVGPIRIDFFEV